MVRHDNKPRSKQRLQHAEWTSNLVAGKSIALVGLPGSGKSTVGRQLARRTGWEFIDTDQVIESRLDCSIREYFETVGERSFREIESSVIEEFAGRVGVVLSTGGGAVLTPSVCECLQKNFRGVYLHSSPVDVYRRLRHDQTRPLLQVADPLARLTELYTERDPLYRAVALAMFETGRPTVAQLVLQIVAKLDLIAPAAN